MKKLKFNSDQQTKVHDKKFHLCTSMIEFCNKFHESLQGYLQFNHKVCDA